MKEVTMYLYGEPGNNAVLRFPDRKSPGVLIQGDTLRNILESSELIAKLTREHSGELADEAEGLCESLREIYQSYREEIGET